METHIGSGHIRMFGGTVGLGILTVVLATPLVPFDQQSQPVFPPNSTPFGMTYGDWAAAWFQYAFSIPASNNPLPDTTGENCNVGQSSGPVFFLAESCMIPGGQVTRSCTLPAGKALFVPIAVVECSTADSPPFQVNNGQAARTCAASVADGIDVGTLHLTIDGKKVPDLRRFRAQSPFYDFVLPAQDNILGLTGVTLGASGADGYWVMLSPLPRGTHVLRFGGDYVTGPMAGLKLDVTYNLNIE